MSPQHFDGWNFIADVKQAYLTSRGVNSSHGLVDDVQRPPVLDLAVYITPKNKSPASMLGHLVWKDFNKAVSLKTIIRQ